MRKRKKKHDKISLKFEGKRVTIVKYSFLPPNTIGLSADLFNELKKNK